MTQFITMPDAFAAKEALLADLLAPSLLSFTLDTKPVSHTIVADSFFHPLPQVQDIEIAHLPGPVGHSALLVRGRQGAHQERVSMPQRVTIHVLEGLLLLFIPGQEPKPYTRDQWVEVPPHLEHGFIVGSDCLLYNVYTPAFMPV